MGKQRSRSIPGRGPSAAVAAAFVLGMVASSAPSPAAATDDPERAWAHVVVATGYVDNVSVCTWAVCGDPASFYRTAHEERGIMLLDLDAMDLPQRPGPGWWYVDGTFVRDTFERNVTATARILGVELRWSTGGLGMDTGDVTFTVDVAPTGQRLTTSGSSLLIDPLEAGVAHTFTVTATRSDGSTVQGPVVTATPEVDPDPDCTDRSVARECRAATGWATVGPETMLVVNVSVCTPWQCGVDGEWGGRMPADSPWPNFLLIELDGPGGIGWKYVDGTFVDVRPREELEEEAPAPAPEPAPEPDDATSADATEPSDDASTEPEAGTAPAPTTSPDDATSSDAADATDTSATSDAAEEDASEPTVTTAPSDSAPDPATSSGDASPGDATTEAASHGSSTDEPVAATSSTVDEAPAPGPIRRVISGIVSFFRGLFGS